MRRLLLVPIALCLLASQAMAHEIGTTEVHADLRRNHTWQIDIITAPMSLLRKLEVASGERRSGTLPTQEARKRIEAHAAVFAGLCEIRFDGVRVAPKLEVLPIAGEAGSRELPKPRPEAAEAAAPHSAGPASAGQPSAAPQSAGPGVVESGGGQRPQFVVVRMTGEIPEHAQQMTWKYGLTFSAYSLLVSSEGHGEPQRQWLEGDQVSAPVALARDLPTPTRAEIARQYLLLGFTHIVPRGLDHILFVLGIFLLTTKMRQIMAQVTAFTIAHSITLGLTIYGVVSVSPRIVEPAIALSIAYVAIENLVTSELKPWRVAIVFAFGLLHGMGFAGVLKELGLPRSQFATALITFNVGVELGQLTVIAVAFVGVACWARTRPWYRHRFVIPASAVIAATGVFWTVQRVMG